MLQGFIETSQADGNRREIEPDHVLRSRQLLQRLINRFGPLAVAAVRVGASEQWKAQCQVLRPVLREKQQIRKRFGGLPVQDECLRAMPSGDRKVGACLDEI